MSKPIEFSVKFVLHFSETNTRWNFHTILITVTCYVCNIDNNLSTKKKKLCIYFALILNT
jgi:hypothetical protein